MLIAEYVKRACAHVSARRPELGERVQRAVQINEDLYLDAAAIGFDLEAGVDCTAAAEQLAQTILQQDVSLRRAS
jgi:hypothetical protein